MLFLPSCADVDGLADQVALPDDTSTKPQSVNLRIAD